MIIGITGGIGSGKSCVTQILKKHGYFVIDADKLARDVVKKGQPTLNKLVKEFGDYILTKDGRLNRKRLAKLCFNNDSNYKRLNAITGPAIKKHAENIIKAHNRSNIALEVILLFESGWDKMCDKTIAVCADTDIRIKRVTKRDHCSKEDALDRINRQMSDNEYKKLADIVLYNNAGLKSLENDVIKHLDI
ncbi:MAG: dephospho-CoA kinase [Bacillota bacterium]|nr:dephospho-CoA kinase [Bacillota bacterium]